jgi:hypothetical protein
MRRRGGEEREGLGMDGRMGKLQNCSWLVAGHVRLYLSDTGACMFDDGHIFFASSRLPCHIVGFWIVIVIVRKDARRGARTSQSASHQWLRQAAALLRERGKQK